MNNSISEEIWKDIKDYKGYYEVSSKGRVRSLTRHVDAIHPISGNPYKRKLKGSILKQSETRGEYLMVGLCRDGISKLFRVNRLVAITFLENPSYLQQVGHMDDDRQNNQLNNLYWTDAKENNNHNDKPLRMREALASPIVGVNQYNRIYFKSSKDAERKGYNGSAIRNCISGRSKTHKGYEWYRC